MEPLEWMGTNKPVFPIDVINKKKEKSNEDSA